MLANTIPIRTYKDPIPVQKEDRETVLATSRQQLIEDLTHGKDDPIMYDLPRLLDSVVLQRNGLLVRSTIQSFLTTHEAVLSLPRRRQIARAAMSYAIKNSAFTEVYDDINSI